jgi:GNAT superfamily N-acetyltransferase
MTNLPIHSSAVAVQVRRVLPGELLQVHLLLSANGWGHRIASVGALASLVEASQIAEVAVLDGEVVGFARGLSDGLSNGYLSMVVVADRHRGKGIGRRLVEHALGTAPNITWVLRAGREGAADFFGRLGFEASSLAMERRRTPSADWNPIR